MHLMDALGHFRNRDACLAVAYRLGLADTTLAIPLWEVAGKTRALAHDDCSIWIVTESGPQSTSGRVYDFECFPLKSVTTLRTRILEPAMGVLRGQEDVPAGPGTSVLRSLSIQLEGEDIEPIDISGEDLADLLGTDDMRMSCVDSLFALVDAVRREGARLTVSAGGHRPLQ